MRQFALFGLLLSLGMNALAESCPEHLGGEYRKLHASESVNLCDVINKKPALVVNTASHCGYTKQFSGLEALHQKYQAEGLVVIGFASNAFKQAAKSEAEAADICYTNYGVSFTMLAPTEVTGTEANALFRWLAEQTVAPSWNFNKYLINPKTGAVKHFDSRTAPNSEALTKAIEAAL
ncbi:glutathione peroxidase [Gilvimarinus agarilyticus]|uniref:glutathione peroxidase n=1 Tax=Gilvimarinus sp. 2_MG-2023 TaxID=3062666 RepID=UPI001C096470|nr:glutathione peroxidase [Gilvimarinus sp. 2_MG-2023]MBU2884423.1 glutathione peroxidase [Gilvimarinus agarilyticus]MDO6569559.1 glutathione peroxidase [Gilvimarinus sp. 2_MG-2023]